MKTAWLFSLIRSGSSVTAYGAAAPWGAPVADEPFGPWDRTGDPYRYPPEQAELKRLFDGSGHRLTAPVVECARRLFAGVAGGHDRLIVKIPHDRPLVGEVRAAFPGDGAAFLLRNPLHRLNSMYVRGMIRPDRPAPIVDGHDLARFKEFAAAWERSAHRVLYDDLRRDPRGFFATLYRAWGWGFTDADLDRAAEYARRHYHAGSRRLAPRSNPRNVVSEAKVGLPREAVGAYLGDREVVALMRRVGWSTDAADYGGVTA